MQLMCLPVYVCLCVSMYKNTHFVEILKKKNAFAAGKVRIKIEIEWKVFFQRIWNVLCYILALYFQQ